MATSQTLIGLVKNTSTGCNELDSVSAPEGMHVLLTLNTEIAKLFKVSRLAAGTRGLQLYSLVTNTGEHCLEPVHLSLELRPSRCFSNTSRRIVLSMLIYIAKVTQ